MIPPLPLAEASDKHRPPAPLGVLPAFPDSRPTGPAPARRTPLPPLDSARATRPNPTATLPELRRPAEPDPRPDFTDADLAEAIGPLIPAAHFQAPFPAELPEFEAVLRAAFRRALAQHSASPFDRPDFVQRFLWRFDALLSSRSYEEIVDQKIRRFRVEEVFLFDATHLSLVSFASVNPARHASARKAGPTAHRVAAKIREHAGRANPQFPFERGQRVVVREGGRTVLAAIVRGEPDALVAEDLDYALRRIEKSFGSALADGTPLLHELQPFLEECLLIHSPVAPPAV